ncbi:MAG: universal stress protein [Flavobacteriales bacterium]|nr:universal stress protein [Flavobacteriales bacterium]
MTVKTIVVPLISLIALPMRFARPQPLRATGACIDVVHVYEQMTDFHPENQKLRDEIEAKLDRVPQLPFLEGVELKKFMLRQLALTEMFKNDRIAQADLIVMGSHGATGLRGIVGSNTQRIVRNAPMPVLVIKHHVEELKVNDLVFASNFSPIDVEKFDAFRPVIDIWDPKVHLLKVNTPKSFRAQ